MNTAVACNKIDPDAWTDEGKIIYFSVMSDGTTGPEWIEFFNREDNFYDISYEAKHFLRSNDFKPSSGVKYRVAVMKGQFFAEVDSKVEDHILEEAKRLGFSEPNAEIACLVRRCFNFNECVYIRRMGLCALTVMHQPFRIKGHVPDAPHRLYVDYYTLGSNPLSACWGFPMEKCDSAQGFVFIASQSAALTY